MSGLSGKTVNFTLNGSNVGSAATNASGVATLSGVNLAGINAGTYATAVGANFAGDSSYATSNGTGSLTVGKATLTANITVGNKEYDGTTAATFTIRSLSGVVGTDSVILAGGTATFADKNTGFGKAVTGTGFSLTGAAAGNYTLASTTLTTTASITAKAITGSFAAAGKVYDGTTSATIAGRSLSGAISGDAVSLTGGTATFADKNAGTGKTVTGAGFTLTGTDAGNYSLGPVATTTADISKKALTVSATGQNKVYDGSTAATVTLSDDRVGGDTLTLGYTAASFGDKSKGTGKTVSVSGISVTGADAGNYSFNTTATATADVTARTLTVSTTGVDKVYDGTTTAAVILSSDKLAGDAVTLDYTSAAFADANAGTGKAVAVSGITISGADAGNYSLSTTTSAATANITKATAAVTLGGLSFTYNGSAQGATATTNPVGLTGVSITYDGSSTAPTNAGNYAVIATLTNDNYQAVPVQGTLTITKAATTTVVTIAPGTYTYTGSAHTPATVSVTGPGGLSLAPTATYLNNVNAGTATASYSFAETDNYLASTDSQTFTIAKAAQTINVTTGAPSSAVYNTSFGVAATASSGLPVSVGVGGVASLSGTTVTMTSGTGTAKVTYTQAGNDNYHAAEAVVQTVTAQKANQTVGFNATLPASAVYGTSFDAAATSTSGLAVTYSVAGVGSLAGSTLTMTSGTGTVTVTASQAGDDNYNPASVSHTVTAQKAVAPVGLGDLSQTFTGSALSATATTTPSGLNVIFAYSQDGAAVASPTNAGSFAVTATISNADYQGSATGTLVIAKATVTVDVTWAGGTYSGGAFAATGTVNGPGGLSATPTFTYYAGSSATGTPLAGAPVNAGTYTVKAEYAGNTNYNSAFNTATITISPATATVTVVDYTGTYDGQSYTASVTITGVAGVALAADSVSRANAGSDSVTVSTSDPNYNDVSGTATISIAKANATIGVQGFSGVYDGNPHGATGSATGVQGEPLAGLDLGASFANVPGGTAAWTYTDQTGNYNNSSGSVQIVIAKADQTITFNQVRPDGVTRFALSATGGNSGNPVTFEVVSGPALIVNGELIITGVGTNVVVRASQDGNGNYKAARPWEVTFDAVDAATVCGVAFKDFNHDSNVDFGEDGVGGLTVTLTFTDPEGRLVSLTTTTSSSGYYRFDNLLPTLTYTVTMGSASHTAIPAEGVAVSDLNFAQAPTAGDALRRGQTAGIGFWQNKNGQALIKAMNGSPTATQLGSWLAENFSKLFGNLAGMTNSQVATEYQKVFARKGDKLEAQAFATALSMYVTSSILSGGTAAATYGFTVTQDGARTSTFNVGSNGTALDLTNGVAYTLMDILLAVDKKADEFTRLVYANNQPMRSMVNTLLTSINESGNIG